MLHQNICDNERFRRTSRALCVVYHEIIVRGHTNECMVTISKVLFHLLGAVNIW